MSSSPWISLSGLRMPLDRRKTGGLCAHLLRPQHAPSGKCKHASQNFGQNNPDPETGVLFLPVRCRKKVLTLAENDGIGGSYPTCQPGESAPSVPVCWDIQVVRRKNWKNPSSGLAFNAGTVGLAQVGWSLLCVCSVFPFIDGPRLYTADALKCPLQSALSLRKARRQLDKGERPRHRLCA